MEQQEKNSVEVVIGGEVVTLMGEGSDEYFQKVARYIDKKIAEVNRAKTFAGNSFIKTLLISVNIADDLFKEKDKNDELEKRTQFLEEELTQYTKEIGKLESENLLLKDKLSQLQLELNNSRNELEAYIEEFDQNR